jgi:hypothetical protein
MLGRKSVGELSQLRGCVYFDEMQSIRPSLCHGQMPPLEDHLFGGLGRIWLRTHIAAANMMQ